MNTKYESADLILKLYDMRREDVLRQARQWWSSFNPESAQDVLSVLMGEHSGYFRMVSTYWDMAAALVNNGAIDETMFSECNGEHFFVYAKVEPYIEELRGMIGPQLLANLEKLIMRTDGAKERLAHVRELSRKWAAARVEAEKAKAQAAPSA